jgi:hypothetical protein
MLVIGVPPVDTTFIVGFFPNVKNKNGLYPKNILTTQKQGDIKGVQGRAAVARKGHILEVSGSIPLPATKASKKLGIKCMSEFAFHLGEAVKIKISGEKGFIDGRADYTHSVPMYYVHYKASDGRSANAWFEAEKLEIDVQ